MLYLPCRRTMKFLMAILRGAWIVGAPWVAACTERGAPAPEEDHEVQVLVLGMLHNNRPVVCAASCLHA